MTADEIRNLLRSNPISTERMPGLQCEILKEIAAQLAELNENLAVFRDVQSSAGHGLCVAPEAF